MLRIALLACGLVAAAPATDGRPPAAPPASPMAAYQDARAQVGPGADDQVRLALWCEAHGLTAERVRHLARAVLVDPSHPAARGLLGLVAEAEGRDRDREAAILAEYNGRRERTPESADAHWRLALWCESRGLAAEATAHFTAVTRLDPRRAAAWKRLGYRQFRNQWVTAERVAAVKAEDQARLDGDREWRPKVERWKGFLAYRDPARRGDADAALKAISDPRAVPAVLAVLGGGDAASQRMAVEVLGRIDAPASSRALADLAVDAATADVRKAAAETLRRRDPNDFFARLIDRLLDPVRYKVRPVGGPGESGEIRIEGDRVDLARVYTAPPLPAVPKTPGSTLDRDAQGKLMVWVASGALSTVLDNPLGLLIERAVNTASNTELPAQLAGAFGPNGGLASAAFSRSSRNSVPTPGDLDAPRRVAVPVERMREEIDKAAYKSRAQQRDDVLFLQRRNAEVRKANDEVVVTLEAVLGRSLGASRTDWEGWWNDQRGYALASRSNAPRGTVQEVVTPDYTPQSIDRYRFDPRSGYYLPAPDCFAAGTPVRTRDGLRPIESIELGDRVMAQDPTTGALGEKPVVAVFHNPPSETLSVDLGGETLVTTGIQRFWQARRGWVMARDLKPGDEVRTYGGLVKVGAVVTADRRPVYNLEVAGGHDFFVGRAGTLVHDHTAAETVTHPFDAEPGLAGLAAPAGPVVGTD